MSVRIILFLCLIVSAGCFKATDSSSGGGGDSASQGSGGISVSQRSVYSDTSVVFSLTASTAGNFTWKVTRESDGADLTSRCRLPNANDPRRLECLQLSPGAVIVSVNGSWIRVNVLDPGRGNLAPVLICDVFRANAGNTKIGRVSSDFTKEERRTPAVEGDNIRFDCSPTTDERGATNVAYEIVENAGQPGERVIAVPTGGTSGNISVSAPGSKSMLLRATDNMGRASETRFELLVACGGPNDIQVALEPDQALSVTPIGGPRRSFYRFDATQLFRSPRGNPLLYQFDFNGDGAMDAHPEGGIIRTWLSSAVVNDVYVAFAANAGKTRQVRVQVRDTVCNYYREVAVNKDFPSARLLPGQSDQTGGAYLVQADLAPLNAAASGSDVIRATQADLQMWDNVGDPRRPYVNCTWNRGSAGSNDASITINGIHNYYASDPDNKRAGASTDHIHGLSFTMEGLPHIPMNSSVNYVRDESQSVLRSMSYLSAPGFENLPPKLEYRVLGQACTFQIRVETMPSGGTCSDAPGSPQTYTLIVRGDFDCPRLSTASTPTRTIEVKRGVFYCEANLTDMCVGGGGGGGNPIQGI